MRQIGGNPTYWYSDIAAVIKLGRTPKSSIKIISIIKAPFLKVFISENLWNLIGNTKLTNTCKTWHIQNKAKSVDPACKKNPAEIKYNIASYKYMPASYIPMIIIEQQTTT